MTELPEPAGEPEAFDPNAAPDPLWQVGEPTPVLPPIPAGGWVTLRHALPSPPNGPTAYQGPPLHQDPQYQGAPPGLSYQGPPPVAQPYPNVPMYPGPSQHPLPTGPQFAPGPQPPGGWENLGPAFPPVSPAPAVPPSRRRRGALIAAVVTAAVIAGGTASVVAFSNTSSGFGGASSPQAAVTSLVSDLNKSDLLGILDHLPPAERSALIDPLNEEISEEKRLGVLRQNADPGQVSGVDITASGIQFAADGDEPINDHLSVVKIVGGTIEVNTDLSQVPYTQQFLDTVFPGGLPAPSTSQHTINLAQVDREHGPVRIAAEKVGNSWYPSLFYTIADTAVHDSGLTNPGPADYIAPKGAPTPVDAVQQAITAIENSDYQRLIELTSPDDMRVLHDYGGLILRNATPGPSNPSTVRDLQLTTKKVSGATQVSLQSITVDTAGDEVTVTVDGNCLDIADNGVSHTLCANDIATVMHEFDVSLTATQSAALSRFVTGIPQIGIDVTSTAGQWYVDPVRSVLNVSNTLLAPLQGNDLLVLLQLLQQH